jgi:hypothetical protein
MVRFSLVRRRQVSLPTIAGWLLLAGIAVTLSVFAGLCIHPYLAANAPVPGTRLLVVEGWLEPKELDQAIAVFKNGRYKQLVTTGGPIERWPELFPARNYADLAAAYIRKQGLEDAAVTAVPAPASAQDRTFLSAVKLRNWMKQQGPGFDSLDIFSGATHARRSRMVFRMALGPNVAVGIIS